MGDICLTKREKEILQLTIEGHGVRVAGEKLGISKRRVEIHLLNIYEKLQVSNRVQAYRRAVRLGLV